MSKSISRARPTRLGRLILRQIFDARHQPPRPHLVLADARRDESKLQPPAPVIGPPA